MALEDNLIHSWTLDGNSNDNKGSYNGTDTSMTYDTGRRGNQAGVFSGSGHIATTATDFPSGTGAVSFAGWFKTSSAIRQSIFGYGAASSTNAFIVYMNVTTGKISVSQYGAGVDSADGYADNNWHFLVVTCAAGADPTYTIYVDGSVNGTPATMTTNKTAAASYIGTDVTDVAGNEWVGNIQDLALWSRELSSAEVTSLWNGGDGMYFNGTNFLPYGSQTSASASPSASPSPSSSESASPSASPSPSSSPSSSLSASPSSSVSASPSLSGSPSSSVSSSVSASPSSSLSPSSSPSSSESASISASPSSSVSASPSSSVSASPSSSLSSSVSASPSSSRSASLSSSISASPSQAQYEDLYTAQGTTYTNLYREF